MAGDGGGTTAMFDLKKCVDAAVAARQSETEADEWASMMDGMRYKERHGRRTTNDSVKTKGLGCRRPTCCLLRGSAWARGCCRDGGCAPVYSVCAGTPHSVDGRRCCRGRPARPGCLPPSR